MSDIMNADQPAPVDPVEDPKPKRKRPKKKKVAKRKPAKKIKAKAKRKSRR